jgi:hypothetical protein
MDFTIKNGDTRTAMKLTLYNPSGTRVDLTNASAQLILSDGINKVTVPALIQDTNGVVWVNFEATTLSPFNGWIKGELKVTFNDDGKIESYPNDSYIKINVVKGL